MIERKKETDGLNKLTIYIFKYFVFLMFFVKKVPSNIKQKTQNSIFFFLKTPN